MPECVLTHLLSLLADKYIPIMAFAILRTHLLHRFILRACQPVCTSYQYRHAIATRLSPELYSSLHCTMVQPNGYFRHQSLCGPTQKNDTGTELIEELEIPTEINHRWTNTQCFQLTHGFLEGNSTLVWNLPTAQRYGKSVISDAH